jgi:NTP pyrophosphatase (non-canonical NTP hydrolase)
MNLKIYSDFVNELTARLDNDMLDQLHMILGIGTELGELEDQYKKHMAYGKDLDTVNVEEELGDILFYVTGLCNLLNITLEGVMEQNVNKLTARYGGNKFTKDKALNRNLEKERKVLEGHSQLELFDEPPE